MVYAYTHGVHALVFLMGVAVAAAWTTRRASSATDCCAPVTRAAALRAATSSPDSTGQQAAADDASAVSCSEHRAQRPDVESRVHELIPSPKTAKQVDLSQPNQGRAAKPRETKSDTRSQLSGL